MNKTAHYEFKKPEATDFYDVKDFNENADAIDSALFGKQDKAISRTITIKTTDWYAKTCNKAVAGVSTDNTVIVSPAPSSSAAYNDAGVVATAQSTDTLTFVCAKTPTVDLSVDIMIGVALSDGPSAYEAEIIDARDDASGTTYDTLGNAIRGQVEDLMDMIAGIETEATASQDYAKGDLLIKGMTLYKATAAIATGSTLTVGTNISATTIADEFIALKEEFSAIDITYDSTNKKIVFSY